MVIVNWASDAYPSANSSLNSYSIAVTNSFLIAYQLVSLFANVGLNPSTDIHCIGHGLGLIIENI